MRRALFTLLFLFLSSTLAEAACSHVSTTWTCVDTGNVETNGDNFQNALDNAVPGETIVLTAGVSFQTRVTSAPLTGNPFFLRANASASNPITIKSSDLASLPAGVRVSTASSSHMPKLVSGSSSWVIEADLNAGGYVFQGIEFTNTAIVGLNNGESPMLVYLSSQSAGYGEWGHEITLDRCLFWPYEEWAGGAYRSINFAIRADGANHQILNSYVTGFFGPSTFTGHGYLQSSAVVFVNGPGPALVENNFLEAMYSNIFFGGGGQFAVPAHTATISASTATTATLSTVADLIVGDYIAFIVPTYVNASGLTNRGVVGKVTNIAGSVVTFTQEGEWGPYTDLSSATSAQWRGLNISDVTIRRNTISKRSDWGSAPAAKSFSEMKTGSNVLWEGNIFTGPMPGGTASLGFGQQDQANDSPWEGLFNVTIRSNLFQTDGYWGLRLAALYNGNITTPGGPITYENNLFTAQTSYPHWPPYSMFDQGYGGPIIVTHNTFRGNVGAIWSGYDAGFTIPNLTFQDNVVNSGTYWLNGLTDDPQAYFTGITKDHNIIINNSGFGQPYAIYNSDFVVANDAAVGFADVTSADAGGSYLGYKLAGGTSCTTGNWRNCGSDGKDPGVDFAVLSAALGLAPATLTGPLTIKGPLRSP